MKKFMMIIGLLASAWSQAQSFEKDRFTTQDGKELVITFIKHASLMLEFDGHVIQVDPVSAYADYSQFPQADVILITHEHPDHLDPQAIKAVEKPSTLLIANPASRQILGKGEGMKNGDRLNPVPYLQLEAVPAYNTTPGREKFHPKGRDNGYILTVGGSRIYIAGDTEDIPEMQEIKNIDIAFLPVNQPYTMTPSQAARAAKTVAPKVFYPYHYGDTKIEEVKDLLKPEKNIEVRIRQLQ